MALILEKCFCSIKREKNNNLLDGHLRIACDV